MLKFARPSFRDPHSTPCDVNVTSEPNIIGTTGMPTIILPSSVIRDRWEKTSLIWFHWHQLFLTKYRYTS